MRDSTFPMPRLLSSWRAALGSESTSSASVGCCGLCQVSERESTSCSRAALRTFIRQRECERPLLPDDLLPLRVKDGQAIIGYLGDGDQAWLRALIDEFERFAG